MIDLHVHSTASDGSLSPEEVVGRASELGLRAVAIADHDTVAGIEPALAAAQERGLLLIPAVELSCDYHSAEVHLLGYFLDWRHAELREMLREMREERQERARRMVEKLQELGLPLEYEEVAAVAQGESVGRPHVATALQQAGVVRTPQEAFDRFIGRGRPAYVGRGKLSPEEARGLIARAGGLAVLAHPGLIGSEWRVQELLADLEGLEVYHSMHSAAQTRKYRALAAARGLLITGGTDSHGAGGSAPVEIGAVEIPDAEGVLERLLAWARAHDRQPPGAG